MMKEIDWKYQLLDIYEQKHRGGHRVSEHHHRTHQLLFVLEGVGKLKLDGRAYDLMVGDTVLVAPYSVHAVMSDSKLTLLVLAFDVSALHSQITDPLHAYIRQSALMRPSLFAASELKQQLRKMMFEQSTERSELGRLALMIQLSQLLLLLARFLDHPTASTGSNWLRAEKILLHIDSNYYDPLSPEDLAAKMDISSRHVNAIFKERYDYTPMQYLTEVRIRVAQRLLSETDKDIITICFEVGYNSVSTFYRTFKTVVGLSPKLYRKMNRPVETE